MKNFTKIVLCAAFFFSPSVFAIQDNDLELAGVIASATAKRVAGVASLVVALGFGALSIHLAHQSGRHEELEKQKKEKKQIEDSSSWPHYRQEEKESKSSGYALGSWACLLGVAASGVTSALFFGAAHTQGLREQLGQWKNWYTTVKDKLTNLTFDNTEEIQHKAPVLRPSYNEKNGYHFQV